MQPTPPPPASSPSVTFSHAVYCHISDFIRALGCIAASVARPPVAEVGLTPGGGRARSPAPPPPPAPPARRPKDTGLHPSIGVDLLDPQQELE